MGNPILDGMNTGDAKTTAVADPGQRDAALVLAVRTGDMSAFETLVAYYHQLVTGLANGILQDSSLADDSCQEVFLQAFLKLDSLQDPRRFGPWLKTLTLRACWATADKEGRRHRREQLRDVDLCDPWLDAQQDDDDAVEQWVRQVRAAVDRLSAQQHEVLYLYYVAGHNLVDIANFLDCPGGTVKRRLHDARQSLRREVPDSTPGGDAAAHRIISALSEALHHRQNPEQGPS